MGGAGKEGAARCLSWDHRGAHGIHSPLFSPSDEDDENFHISKGRKQYVNLIRIGGSVTRNTRWPNLQPM